MSVTTVYFSQVAEPFLLVDQNAVFSGDDLSCVDEEIAEIESRGDRVCYMVFAQLVDIPNFGVGIVNRDQSRAYAYPGSKFENMPHEKIAELVLKQMTVG